MRENENEMKKASGICYYNINVIINKWIQCEFLMGKKLQLSKLCIIPITV